MCEQSTLLKQGVSKWFWHVANASACSTNSPLCIRSQHSNDGIAFLGNSHFTLASKMCNCVGWLSVSGLHPTIMISIHWTD